MYILRRAVQTYVPHDRVDVFGMVFAAKSDLI